MDGGRSRNGMDVRGSRGRKERFSVPWQVSFSFGDNRVIAKNTSYSLPFQVTPESKFREFQYKILNDRVFTYEKLFRFGLTQSSNCAFCQKEPESIEHLLFLCKVSSDFWKHVLSWLRDNNISIMSLDVTDVIFGKFDIKEDFLLGNIICA